MDITTLDYDEMKAAGWDYHRNGVSGLGFFVKYEEDRPEPAVLVSFHYWDEDIDGPDDHWVNAKPIVLPWRAIELTRKALEATDRVEVTDEYTIVGFHDGGDRMLGVWAPRYIGDGVPFAVFDIDILPDVRFFYNSYRGDVYAHRLGLS
jgi:hypothetical protein